MPDANRTAVRITVTSESGHLTAAGVPTPPATTHIEDLPPAAYTVDVTGLDAASGISPVSSTVLIWEADAGC